MRAHVGCPNVSFAIDAEAMTAREQALCESADKISIGVELKQRLRAAIQHEHMSAGIESHAGRRSQGNARWKGQRVRDGYIIQFGCSLRDQQGGIRRPLSQQRRGGQTDQP